MMDIPTVTMIGPAGQVVVNHNEVQQWRDRGYRRLDEAAAAASPVAKKAPAKKAPAKKKFGKKSSFDNGE